MVGTVSLCILSVFVCVCHIETHCVVLCSFINTIHLKYLINLKSYFSKKRINIKRLYLKL